MKQFSEETRKRMSEAAKLRCKRQLPKAAFKWVPFCSKEELEADYHGSNMTQVEISQKYRVSQKVVWLAMSKYGIPRRKAAKRNQLGENNSTWKGQNALYGSFHARVQARRGKASGYPCSQCGTTDPKLNYDWANLTGDYNDTDDFSPMCRSCHRKYDKARRR